MKAHLLISAVLARLDEPCMATQRAIDALGAANGQDRARLVAWLKSATNAEIVDAVAVAWAKCDLKLATGRNRDEWWAFFSRPGGVL